MKLGWPSHIVRADPEADLVPVALVPASPPSFALHKNCKRRKQHDRLPYSVEICTCVCKNKTEELGSIKR
jgi:hypothetical protein